jgi:hypothetical protein
LAEFDGTSWRLHRQGTSGFPHDRVLSFALDGSTKWVGTWGGLAESDGVGWTTHSSSNSGLPDDWVLAVAVDESGNTWTGTWLGGLAAYREGGVVIGPAVGHVRGGRGGRVRP